MYCLRIKGGESLPSRAGQMLNSRVANVNFAKADLREDFKEKRLHPEGELIKVRVNSRENSFVQIGAKLQEDLKTMLTEQLLQNADPFTWVLVDMLGIDLNFMSYQLAIKPTTRPVA